ncbi:MAG: CPBP family intramembrane glutamic endopeptidase [Ginsengibacter sp.]
MINSICDCLLQLLFLTPFVVLARRGNENLKTGTLILASLVFIATSVPTDLLSHISILEGQGWNWGGKTISLIIALIFIFSYKPIAPRQFGLTTKIETKNARPILLICTGYSLIRLILYLTMTKEAGTFHIEAILYQATMPGIVEEVIFRGILLRLLNQAFVNPKWIFANVTFGWAAIITSLLFGLTHSTYFDNNYHIHFDFLNILRLTFDGFLFALLVEKTKSLIPSILFHNILNLIGNH